MTTFNEMYDSLDVPVLAHCAIGGTGYLDQFKNYDMTARVMKGADEHGRKFIALLLRSCPKSPFTDAEKARMSGNVSIDADGNSIGVMAFFQRYSEPQHAGFWVMGARYGLDTEFFRTPSGADVDKVQKLLNGERLTIASEYSGFAWVELCQRITPEMVNKRLEDQGLTNF